MLLFLLNCLFAYGIQMVNTSRKQPSGSSNRKKAKTKKIEIANVMAKVPCINSYFKANNTKNSSENTSSMLYF